MGNVQDFRRLGQPVAAVRRRAPCEWMSEALITRFELNHKCHSKMCGNLVGSVGRVSPFPNALPAVLPHIIMSLGRRSTGRHLPEPEPMQDGCAEPA